MILILYTSSRSNNTHDFLQKLIQSGYPEDKILRLTEDYVPEVPFVLFTSSYCDSEGNDPYHPVLEKWMDLQPNWYKLCKGTVVSGHDSFGAKYGAVASILQKKHNIPRLHRYNLKGRDADVRKVMFGMKKMFGA